MDEEVKKIYIAMLKEKRELKSDVSRDGKVLWFWCEEPVEHYWSEAQVKFVAAFTLCGMKK